MKQTDWSVQETELNLNLKQNNFFMNFYFFFVFDFMMIEQFIVDRKRSRRERRGEKRLLV